MLQPIQKDHELMCPSCGCVLGKIQDNEGYTQDAYYGNTIESYATNPSLNIFLLGSALEKNVKFKYQRNPQQIYEERGLRKLVDITKEFALPEVLAYDTFKVLKKKRRGFRSEKEPIKQLIQILSKDDNYLHIHKMRAIKKKYEALLNS